MCGKSMEFATNKAPNLIFVLKIPQEKNLANINLCKKKKKQCFSTQQSCIELCNARNVGKNVNCTKYEIIL